MRYRIVKKRKTDLIPPSDIDRLLNLQDVAALMGVSVRTVRRRRDAGKMPPVVRNGKLIQWRKSDIERMLREM